MTDDQTSERAETSSSASPEPQPKPIDAAKDKATSPEADPASKSDDDNSSPDTDPIESNDKGKAAATTSNPGPWQAIYSPQYSAYYFYNSETQETTWTNPLASSDLTTEGASSSTSPEPESQTSAMTSGSLDPRYAALQQAAMAQGIDPALAYLDPSLGAAGSTPAAPGSFTFSAKFNARTGQFTPLDGRDPTHLGEYERMKRMSEFYFDVNAWEQQLAEQGGSIIGGEEESTKKRKRPSKKDLERFKEQKRLKKIAKTAWLRT